MTLVLELLAYAAFGWLLWTLYRVLAKYGSRPQAAMMVGGATAAILAVILSGVDWADLRANADVYALRILVVIGIVAVAAGYGRLVAMAKARARPGGDDP